MDAAIWRVMEPPCLVDIKNCPRQSDKYTSLLQITADLNLAVVCCLRQPKFLSSPPFKKLEKKLIEKKNLFLHDSANFPIVF